jgi:hypothetical protein
MSLNTNGWDLIYNIKFDKANALLKNKFLTDIVVVEELNTTLAEAIADGFKKEATLKKEAEISAPARILSCGS